MPEVNIARFAALLEVSPAYVSQRLIVEGLPHTRAEGRGKPVLINVREALDWLIARERARHLARDGKESLVAAELRRARALADLAELREAERANALIDREDVQAVLAVVLAAVDAHLPSLCAVAGRVAAESDPALVREIVFRECRRIRRAIADELARAAET